MRERVIEGFVAHFGYPPTAVVRAPGRVNLLGEHTDYNEGYVLPMAVDRAAWVAAAPLPERVARIAALDLGEEAGFSLAPVPPSASNWADYPRGVAWALEQAGLHPVGLAAALASDVPMGGGMSSSAAVEVAFAWTWRALSGFDLDRTGVALLCQQAENEYVGVRCGVMDQIASAWGRAGHALWLDCRTLEIEPVPLPARASIVVADTGVRRELAASEYNRRRAECERAVQILSAHLPGIRALRDVAPDDLARLAHHLPDVERKRARHVVSENARVLDAVDALRAGDLAPMGDLMRGSHASLRDDYQVSSPELDLLAETAWDVKGCYGARLTGAGFGGCIVALVDATAVDRLLERLEWAYVDRFGRKPTPIVCSAADGVGSWTVSTVG